MILITGASGQVGQALAETLLQKGAPIEVCDILPKPVNHPIFADIPWHVVDIRERAAVQELITTMKPSRVFHLAAILSARGESDPEQAYEINQTGTYNLLQACQQNGVSQFIFASTIAVFGPGVSVPVADDAPLQPTTMYGVTKASCELLGQYYARHYGLDFRALRFPGLISATLPGGGTSDYAPLMYIEAIRSGYYQAFCRPDTRIPLMYMSDAMRALSELADAPKDRLSRCVYNIRAFSPSAEEIAAAIREHLPQAQLTFQSDPVRQAILDSWPQDLDDRNARHDWHWQPRYDLKQMTTDLMQKFQKLILSPSSSHAR